MDIACGGCKKVIHLQQPYPYHAGFSDVGFLYCGKDSTILVFSAYNRKYTKLVNALPWNLDEAQRKKVEQALKPCHCGGSFLFSNKPKCPHCHTSIEKLLPSSIHYVILTEEIDGDKEDVWKA